MTVLLAQLPFPAWTAEGEKDKGEAAEQPKPVAPDSLWFCLRKGPSEQVHLLTYEFGKNRFALRVRSGQRFGAPRYVQSPLGAKEDPNQFDLQVAPDGSLHIFLLKSEGKGQADFRMAYLSPVKAEDGERNEAKAKAKTLKPSWVPLTTGPRDSWSWPQILPQRNGALEVLSRVATIRQAGGEKIIESFRLVRGLVQRGRFRVTGSVDLDKGAFSGLTAPHFMSLPGGEPLALFLGKDGMAWTTLKKFQSIPACASPREGILESGTLAVLARSGLVYLAFPESIDAGKAGGKKEKQGGYRFRIARGKPLAALEDLGHLPAEFSFTEAVLAESPGGQVWFFGVPGRTQDPHPITAWELSGKPPLKPVPTPWPGAPHHLEAVFTGGQTVCLAFTLGEGICVEEATLTAPDVQ